MLDFFKNLFASDFVPHGQCYHWEPSILWLHVVSDGMITLAFYSIPIAILYLVRKRKDLAFHWMFLMFGAFIFACGTTHLLQVWTIWDPIYRVDGIVKLGTGVLSIATAVLLVLLVPRALALPSPSQLERTNRELARQIEERKRAETGLARALAEISNIMETIPDLVCVLDATGHLVRWNRRVELITGFAPEELTGKQATTFFPAGEEPLLREAIRRTLEDGYAEVEGNLLRRDGSSISYQFTGAAMKNECGDVIGLTAVGRDVSERKQAEHLRNALREKEILLKELHHRVKNNLQVVTSLLSLQASHVQDRQALEMFGETRNRVRLIAKVHEALYRGENLSRLDASSFVREITNNLFRSYAINPEAIRLTTDLDPEPLGVDLAVPCGLIINELVSNALKHAFPGDRTGEIRVELRREPPSTYRLKVMDDGVGPPRETVTGAARTLGWELVSALTRQLGGSIEIRTDRGTEVTVTFPAPS